MRPGPVGGSLGDLRDPLYVNSFFLLANSVVPPALAFFFWYFVARYFEASMVGEAVALVLPATLLATGAGLGLQVGLVRFLPTAGPKAPAMVRSSLTLTLLAALGLVGVFMATIPLWGQALVYVVADPRYVLAFFLLTEATALSAILDSIFIAYRRASYALVRNAVFGLVRIPLPFLFVALAWMGGISIFLCYALGALASLAVAMIVLLPRTLPKVRMRPGLDLASIREAMAFSLGNHVSALANLLPASILPLMVIASAETPQGGLALAAYFYMALQGALLLFIVPGATASSLLAEGSNGIMDYPQGGRRALLFTFLILGPAVLITFALGDSFLGFFGPGYAREGGPLLRLFSLASLPMAVNSIYMTSLRLERRVPAIVAVGVTPVFIILTTAYYLLPLWGLPAVGWGWLLGQGAVTLGVTLLDPLRNPLRLLISRSATPGPNAVPALLNRDQD